MTIQAVRGTRDILPDEVAAWHAIEAAARDLFARYGYREIRTPIFEETELFARGIGAETDIVAKEMYTFADRDGGSLTLRPEATAGVVRAVIEHNLMNNDPALKVYAMGPMFRRERPQKGRYRQFHQVDVEAFGFTSPTIDAEVIELALGYLDACGVSEHELVLNSVGDRACRPAYVERLRAALRDVAPTMCGDCQRRRRDEPAAGPRLQGARGPGDDRHAAADHRPPLRGLRDALRRGAPAARAARHPVPPEPPPGARARLLRAHDLRGHEHAARRAESHPRRRPLRRPREEPGRARGGRRRLRGRAWSGWPSSRPRGRPRPAATSSSCRCPRRALDRALRLQRELRQAGLCAMLDPEGRSFKSRMKQADRLGARFVAILGDDEIARGAWAVRDMARSEQQDVPEEKILDHLKEKANG